MRRNYLISSLAIISILVCLQTAPAQVDSSEKTSLMMTGEFSDKQATGIYIKGADENLNLDWSVFLGNDGKVYKVTVVRQNIVELFVDGQKIPNENISQYAAETKPFLDNLAMEEEIEKQDSALDAQEAELDEQENEMDKISDKLDAIQDKFDYIEGKRSVDLSAEKDNLSKLRDKNSKLRDELSEKRDALSLQRDKLSEKHDKIDNLNEIYKILQKIISDLKAEGIVKNSNNLSFKLSNRELICNGQRQSSEIHEKLKLKYVGNSSKETGFLYHWKAKI